MKSAVMVPPQTARSRAQLALATLVALALLCGGRAAIAETATQPATPDVGVGTEAPDFTLVSSDGTSFTLSSLRGKKNVVLAFFRGVW